MAGVNDGAPAMSGEALESLANALEEDPAFVDAYYQRALIELDQAKFEQAATDLDEVLALEPAYNLAPETAAAFYKRGEMEHEAGDLSGAISDYGLALQVDDEHSDARYARAMALFEQGDFDDAAADLDNLLAMDTDFSLGTDAAEVYYQQAMGFLEGGEYEQAVSSFETAMNLAPA